MSTILAIDLGKFKSVACTYRTTDAEHIFQAIPTRPQAMHDLIVATAPDRVVIEVGSAAGWVKDLCEALQVQVSVANPNGEAWRWKNIKRKTDKDDALKLAQLTAMGQLPTVTLPSTRVRQWRSLIAYRHTLVSRRTAIKNSIRAILDRQGLTHACGKSGWTQSALETLRDLARPLEEVDAEQLWRGQLQMELLALEQIAQLLEPVEAKLQALADADQRVAQLRTIPGVGPRLAETVVAMIDTTTYTYDDSGIRVTQTVTDADGTTTTTFLVDANNLTGYQQVIEEHTTGDETKPQTYTIGHDVLAQVNAAVNQVLHLIYDAHGSTRALADAHGLVVPEQVYRYDGYGNAVGLTTISALTRLLYGGERNDVTGLHYLRARFYAPAIARFNRFDPYIGDTKSPLSIHKYVFADADPVMRTDPTGMMSLKGQMITVGIMALIATIYNLAVTSAAAFNIGRDPNLLPDGVMFNFGVAGASHGFVAGASVSLYWEFASSTPYILFTGEGGLAPLSYFRTRRGVGWLFTMGPVWNTQSAADLGGGAYTATWPRAMLRFAVPSPLRPTAWWSRMMNLSRYEAGARIKDRQGVVQIAQSHSSKAVGTYIGVHSYTFNSTFSISTQPRNLWSSLGSLGEEARELVENAAAVIRQHSGSIHSDVGIQSLYRQIGTIAGHE